MERNRNLFSGKLTSKHVSMPDSLEYLYTNTSQQKKMSRDMPTHLLFVNWPNAYNTVPLCKRFQILHSIPVIVMGYRGKCNKKQIYVCRRNNCDTIVLENGITISMFCIEISQDKCESKWRNGKWNKGRNNFKKEICGPRLYTAVKNHYRRKQKTTQEYF